MFPLLKLYSTYFLLVYPYISTMLFRCIIYYNCPFPITHYITIRTSLLMYLLKILQGLVPVTLYCCTDPESFPDSRAQAEKKQKNISSILNQQISIRNLHFPKLHKIGNLLNSKSLILNLNPEWGTLSQGRECVF